MPNTDVTASIEVTPLVDNTIWFANAAAWNAYWNGQTITVILPVATTLVYGLVKTADDPLFVPSTLNDTNNLTIPVDLLGTGVFTNFQVPLTSSFDELKIAFQTLQTNYEAMRTAMVTAGLLNRAQ